MRPLTKRWLFLGEKEAAIYAIIRYLCNGLLQPWQCKAFPVAPSFSWRLMSRQLVNNIRMYTGALQRRVRVWRNP